MDTSRKKLTVLLSSRILPFVLLFLALLLIMPRTAKFRYDYRKGAVWHHETLISDFDFPIYKTAEQMEEERAQAGDGSVIPYYRFSDEIVNKNVRAAEALQLGAHASVKNRLVAVLRSVYAQGIVQDEGVRVDKRSANLSDEVLYVQKDKRASKYPVTEVYRQTDARAKVMAEVGKSFPSVNMDSIFRAAGVYDLIVPNLIYDKQTTELVQAESAERISPTQGFVSAGQLIVSEGEIVTAEIAQMLDSYKQEYQSNMGLQKSSLPYVIGNVLVALILVLILFLVIYFVDEGVLASKRRLWYIVFIVFLTALGALLAGRHDPVNLYLVPFTLALLYLRTFFRYGVIVPVYFVALLPLAIFCQNGIVLYVMYIAAGLVAALFYRSSERGWRQFLPCLVAFLVLVLIYTGFDFTGFISGNWGRTALYLFLGSVISGAAYPLTYLFERIFKLLSTTRLVELTDTDNTLLRRLEEKAPGTFQHCLQVMSMAEMVTRTIGGNIALARAGALYHDIGKMKNPLCFVENSMLSTDPSAPSYHANLTPKESARDIIRHVADGLELAAKYRLPEEVAAFIRTHHGTTRTGYFYNKFVSEGGDPADTADFTYPGGKPQTREQVVVMLCDTVEAAARTLGDNSAKAYSDFVDRMIEGKNKEGQFDEADISIADLLAVGEALKTYLAQMYHERIAYPTKLRRRLSSSR